MLCVYTYRLLKRASVNISRICCKRKSRCSAAQSVMATRTTSGRQRYPPVWPTVNSSRQNSDQTSQYRNSVELKASRHDDQSAKPFSFNTSPPYSASFKSSEQTWKLFYPQCWRWLGTGIFIALILATLKIFEDKGNFSHDSKYLFNTIITALSLGLGLNFFVGPLRASSPCKQAR